MRVLAAFDKFKGSVTAPRACAIAGGALAGARGGWVVDACPLTDGGEGFAGILTLAAGGSQASVAVTGPRGGEVAAGLGIVSIDRIPPAALARLGLAAGPGGTVGIVEMASASGLSLLEASRRDPLRASSVGTGQLMRAAALAGVRAILLGVGGSATHDLGLGALGALGIRFTDESGASLEPLAPADWPRLAGLDGKIPEGFPPILIACDVDNPLVGPTGAAMTYGPQKGLRADDAAEVDAQTRRVAGLLCRHFGRPEELISRPGAGAAGGIAFGLMAAAGARPIPGFDLVSSWLGLDARMAAADVVLTGEGRFDETSMSGKGPGQVVRRALALGKRVHVFAGEVSLARGVPGLATHAISPAGMPLAEAMEKAPELLAASVRREFAGG
ncbi:MAG TPA: glycerate kinase [Opitutaceae bacterium]